MFPCAGFVRLQLGVKRISRVSYQWHRFLYVDWSEQTGKNFELSKNFSQFKLSKEFRTIRIVKRISTREARTGADYSEIYMNLYHYFVHLLSYDKKFLKRTFLRWQCSNGNISICNNCSIIWSTDDCFLSSWFSS